MSVFRIGVALLFACFVECGACEAQTKAASPEGLTAIVGHWFVKTGEPPVDFDQDGERYLDLFSDHAKDSNKDGIPNLKLSPDERCLIRESQGDPNHPTAVFPNSGNPNSIRIQKFVFRLPLNPEKSNIIPSVPMGTLCHAHQRSSSNRRG